MGSMGLRGAFQAWLASAVLLKAVAWGYSYAQGNVFADHQCGAQTGRMGFVDTYCAATSASTSVRLCCKGTEAVLLYYGNSQNCVVPKAACMTAHEPFVLTVTNAGASSTHQMPSGYCSWNSVASSTKRTCTGLASLRVETFTASSSCAGTAASSSIVTAPHTDGAHVYSCEPYTHSDLDECAAPPVAIGTTPQGWTNVLGSAQRGWSVYDSSPSQTKPGMRMVPLYNDFPNRMVGSSAKPIPTMQSNLHLRKYGTTDAKETKPSYLTSPDVIYERHRYTKVNHGECEDKAPPKLCYDWAERYGCSNGFLGGKGEREAARQTVAQLCPTACNSNCTNLPYRDLQPSTLKTLGFDFWVNDDHFMNPDRGY